jgi:hypothetical protein
LGTKSRLRRGLEARLAQTFDRSTPTSSIKLSEKGPFRSDKDVSAFSRRNDLTECLGAFALCLAENVVLDVVHHMMSGAA